MDPSLLLGYQIEVFVSSCNQLKLVSLQGQRGVIKAIERVEQSNDFEAEMVVNPVTRGLELVKYWIPKTRHEFSGYGRPWREYGVKKKFKCNFRIEMGSGELVTILRKSAAKRGCDTFAVGPYRCCHTFHCCYTFSRVVFASRTIYAALRLPTGNVSRAQKH